jgi:hypothetical protein
LIWNGEAEMPPPPSIEIAQEQDGGQRGDDLDHEHHRIADHHARIELPNGVADRRHENAGSSMARRGCALAGLFDRRSPCRAAETSVKFAGVHREMLDDGPSARAGKKMRPPTIRITPITRPTNSPPSVGKVPADGGTIFLAHERAGDRQHRHDHQEAADEHREAQRVVEQRVGGEAGEGAAVVAGGRDIGIERLAEAVRPGIGMPASPAGSTTASAVKPSIDSGRIRMRAWPS